MTKQELEAKQKEISQKIVDLLDRKCVGKEDRLDSLMLQLDSLNRAAYYLMKEEK